MPYLNRDGFVEYFDYWTRCPRCALVGPIDPDCGKCSGTGRDYREFSKKDKFDGTNVNDCASLVEAVIAFLYQRCSRRQIGEWYDLALSRGYEPPKELEGARPADTVTEWFHLVFTDILDRGLVGADALDGHEGVKPLPSSPAEAAPVMKYNAAIIAKAIGQRVCLRRVYLPPDSDDIDARDYVLDTEFEPSAVFGEIVWLNGPLAQVKITDVGSTTAFYGGLESVTDDPLTIGTIVTDYHFRWLDSAIIENMPEVPESNEIGWTGRIASPDILDDMAALDRLFDQVSKLSARHGVTDGKGYPICENCFYRVESEQFSPVVGCAHYKIAVGASSTCENFRTSPGGIPIDARRVNFPDVAAMLSEIGEKRESELADLRRRCADGAADPVSEARYWALAGKELELDDLAEAVLRRVSPGRGGRLLNIAPERASELYSKFHDAAETLRSLIANGVEEGVEPYDDDELDQLKFQLWMLAPLTFGRVGRHAAAAAMAALFNDYAIIEVSKGADKELLSTMMILFVLEAYTARALDRNQARVAQGLGQHFLDRAQMHVADGLASAESFSEQVAGVTSLLDEINQVLGR